MKYRLIKGVVARDIRGERFVLEPTTIFTDRCIEPFEEKNDNNQGEIEKITEETHSESGMIRSQVLEDKINELIDLVNRDHQTMKEHLLRENT